MRHFIAALGIIATLALAACGSTTTGAGSPASSGGGVTIGTASVNVKGTTTTVLTSANGMTLYYFVPDTATTPACTGTCTSIWPPLLSPNGNPSGPTALSGTLSVLADSTRAQVEYNGHPLYNYSSDKAPGDATGEGVAGKWHVATPDLQTNAGTTVTPTPIPGYGGYNH